MSPVILRMKGSISAALVVVCLACMTAVGQPPCDEAGGATAHTRERESSWNAALGWFLEQDDTAKERTMDLARATLDPATRSLCETLLAEWGNPLDAELFRRPILVYAQRVEVPEPETVDPPSVVFLEFVVSPSGSVCNVRVTRGVFSDPGFEDVLLSAYASARFRPAIKDGEYVEAEYMMMYRLEKR